MTLKSNISKAVLYTSYALAVIFAFVALFSFKEASNATYVLESSAHITSAVYCLASSIISVVFGSALAYITEASYIYIEKNQTKDENAEQ